MAIIITHIDIDMHLTFELTTIEKNDLKKNKQFFMKFNLIWPYDFRENVKNVKWFQTNRRTDRRRDRHTNGQEII